MTNDTRDDRTWYVGKDPVVRRVFLVLVSLVAWLFEAAILAWVFASRAHHEFRPLYYGFPIIHLLPWITGLQWFGQISKAVRQGAMDERSAATSYSAVLGILITAYVALCAAESLLLSAHLFQYGPA